jgi:hypothetical protein
MGVVVIGGGGSGGPKPNQLSADGTAIEDSDGQTVAVFPNTPKGRKDCIRYLKMLDRESED